MVVFYILLFVPIVIQHVRTKGMRMDYRRKNEYALAIFFLLLTMLVMLRHESVGTDTKIYINHFNRYARLDWQSLSGKTEKEIGFPFFNKVISLVSKEPQFYLSAVAILINAMIWPTYKRLNKDTSLTIVLFCIMSTFVLMFSGIRQMLAVGLGFIAYGFVRKKKLIPFILVVFVALLLHSSAFMLAFMYPLYHAKVTKKWLFVMVPVLAVCLALNKQIFGILTLILEQYTRFEAEISSTGAYTMLILFGMFVVFSFLIPDEKKLDEETIGLRNFLLLTFALQMFAPLHALAMRMSYYYMVFIPLLLPKIIESRSIRWSQVAVLGRHVMVVFFLLYFFLVKANSDGNLDVFPYHFFWENV